MIPNFFQLRVKIVNKIIFLQKLVQNVAKTFKRLLGRLFYCTIFQTIDIGVYMMKIYFQSIDFQVMYRALKSASSNTFPEKLHSLNSEIIIQNSSHI